MPGIEAIIEKIIIEAQGVADSRLEGAKKRAQDILAEREATARAEANERIKRAHQEAMLIEKKAQSAAALEARRELLHEKNSCIQDAIEKLYQAVLAMPANAYFAMLKSQIRDHLRAGDAELILSQRDKKRLPDHFLTDLTADKPTALSLSDRDLACEAGALLVYGDIEYNMSLDALFDDMRDHLTDYLKNELFDKS